MMYNDNNHNGDRYLYQGDVRWCIKMIITMIIATYRETTMHTTLMMRGER